MAEVVITGEQLVQSKLCDAYERSPEWQANHGESGALIYSDWEATRARLLSTSEGTAYLGALVGKGLVPMTREELRAAIKAKKLQTYERIKEST